jgi:CRP-like cAMP-binding protein
MSIINIIKGCPLFIELADEEIDIVINTCQVLTLEQGEYVFHENDEGSDLYIVLTGHCHVVKAGVTLANLCKGDLFGEMILLDETIRAADVIADTYTDVLVINYKTIFGLYTKNPSIFSILAFNLCRLLAVRLRKTNLEMKEISEKLLNFEEKTA